MRGKPYTWLDDPTIYYLVDEGDHPSHLNERDLRELGLSKPEEDQENDQ